MSDRTAADLWPLAEAKLAAPRQRSGLVDRPRIMQVLDAGATRAHARGGPARLREIDAVRAWCAAERTPAG